MMRAEDRQVAPKQNAEQATEGAKGRLGAKKAVVTGAARGIGRAIAEAFAREGADVVGIDMAGRVGSGLQYPAATEGDLEETGRLVRAWGRLFLSMIADVRDLPALRRAADEAERKVGGIDILVVNADVQTFAPFSEPDDRYWHEIVDVNLVGAANAFRAFAPGMIRRRRGRIIFTTSGYSGSKRRVLGLMHSAARDLGEFSITVNAVDPGLTDAMLVRNALRWAKAIAKSEGDEAGAAEVDDSDASAAGGLTPWARPSDVGPFVFLASDEASRVSGTAYDATVAADVQSAA
jgi:NAD(P)-dependent dehydrogenase (short-subunit alcohol dehydrogenase family)